MKRKSTPAGTPERFRPQSRDEMTISIEEGPDREGKTTFFAHWLRDHPETSVEEVKAQIFRTNLEEFRARQTKKTRIVS